MFENWLRMPLLGTRRGSSFTHVMGLSNGQSVQRGDRQYDYMYIFISNIS